MLTIKDHTDIDVVLNRLDRAATVALNEGKRLYVEFGCEKQEKHYTDKQRSALHVWCELFAKALNDAGHYRKVVRINGDIVEQDWSKESFKEDVYKVMLKALSGKESTEEQSTTDPEEVSRHINRHMGERWGVTVGWPSLR